MPKINGMWSKWECFQYAKSLDLNMGYYHILLTEYASNLCIIILPSVKYCYKWLPSGIANFPENFQQKMNDLFQKFEVIHVYIDDLLILTKRDWTYHVHKLELTISLSLSDRPPGYPSVLIIWWWCSNTEA